MNPLLIDDMMTALAPHEVTLNWITNELFRRKLQIEICSNGANEYEVWVWAESYTLRAKTYAVNTTLTEAVIDAMNGYWTEYKQ